MGVPKQKPSQPKIALELTLADRLLEALAALFVLLLGVVPLVYYGDLPDRIPQHYDAAGEVDIYGPKYLLLVLAGVGILLYGLMTWVGRHPHWFNYPVAITPENAERQYRIATRLMRALKLVVVLLFFYITYNTIRIGMGRAEGLSPVLLWVMLGSNGVILLWYFAQAFRRQKPSHG